jgi:hypothetical protein
MCYMYVWVRNGYGYRNRYGTYTVIDRVVDPDPVGSKTFLPAPEKSFLGQIRKNHSRIPGSGMKLKKQLM